MSFLPPLPPALGVAQEQSWYVPSGLCSAGEGEDHREQSCCRDAAATFIFCTPENNFKMSLCRYFVPCFIIYWLLHIFSSVLNCMLLVDCQIRKSLDWHTSASLILQEHIDHLGCSSCKREMEMDSPESALDKTLEKDEVGLCLCLVTCSTEMAKNYYCAG